MNQIKENLNNFKSNSRGDENLGWKCAENYCPNAKKKNNKKKKS